eukprot:Nk52_evm1s2566 gene=Nk52_evmTU1s2566
MFRTNPFRGQFAVAMMAALVVLCVALTHANPMVETHTDTNPVLGNKADAEKYCTDLGGAFVDFLKTANYANCLPVKKNCTKDSCNTFCRKIGSGVRPPRNRECPIIVMGVCEFECVRD